MTLAHVGWEYPPGATFPDLRGVIEDHLTGSAITMSRDLPEAYLDSIRASGFRVSVTITPGPFESKV